MSDHIVSTGWLEEHLDDPAVVILEIAKDGPDTAGYGSGHVPGAQYAYWKDLLWHDTDRQFPSPEVMAARLGTLGVGDETTIALVGDPFQFAAYAYWVMTMAGQESRCRLVDGSVGIRAVVAEGRSRDEHPGLLLGRGNRVDELSRAESAALFHLSLE